MLGNQVIELYQHKVFWLDIDVDHFPKVTLAKAIQLSDIGRIFQVRKINVALGY